MCITKIEAFAYDGKTYTQEIDAIRAAVAKRIGNNEAIARNITDSAADLIPLLQRAMEINAAKNANSAAPAKAQEGPADEKDPAARRSALIGRLQAWGQKDADAAKAFLTTEGFERLAEIDDTTHVLKVERMHADLDEKGVA